MAGRLLYLGNGRKFQSVAKLDDRFETWGLNVDRYWAYDGQFPASLKGYDGIFLSGSPHGAYEDIPFILKEHELIQEAAELDIPMLGICFGSQILASALCGRDQVFRRTSCEIGYKHLPLTEAARSDQLARDLVDSVYMFVWHNDEVRAGHADMTILASSDDCPNQIWRYRDRPVWGIQGHPEVTKAQAIAWFEENRERMEADGADIDHLKAEAHEAGEAKTMLTRFAELVQNGDRKDMH
ncbi:type 1 glutamine amidotransferase [Rhizobium sp. SSA_523]|uniref:type 1 glutamine amidotransferase n=1 Tax=Rhizobium sp. SSA_523 TaxID=2952477 RepID=UPI0020900151|nr:type 1 glutamine amidotransferase [Rhizobium sp. SSA_523]MCO5731191.1 type 1 glutamine amidotransferase [Rhizobium sp. SSA_523]WKC22266.1 type 1 glutamine amidotransferase [Rhizobium sp. SSA_523]